MPATYEPIATTTLSSAASTITFNSISSAYTDLRLIITGTVATNGYQYNLTFNNDSTSLYSQTVLDGDGATATSRRRSNVANLWINDAYVTGGSTTIPSLSIADIFNYAGSTNKTILCNYNIDRNGSGVVGRTVGLYRSTTAISRLDITGGGVNMNAGTTATLYGILKA